MSTHHSIRWLVSLVASVLALLVPLPGARGEDVPTADHTSAAAAEFDPGTRELQVILRLDPEELTGALSALTRRPMTLVDPDAPRATAMLLDSAVQMMDKDGATRSLDWVDMQSEPTWVYVIVQFAIPRDTEGLQISNRIFFSRHDDQRNVMNVKVGADESTLVFTKEQPWQPIKLPAAPKGATTPIPEVVTRGEGPIQMVLIPTHNTDASMYDAFMDRNANRYTMHAITLPGLSGTAPPPEPLPADVSPWIDNDVAATLQVISDLNLDQPVIVGSGLGGIIAYRLAIEHPEAVGPIVTLDAPPAMYLSKEPIAPDQRRMMVDKVMKVQIDNATDQQWQAQLRKLADSIVVVEKRRKELVELFLKTAPDVGKEYLIEHMRIDLSSRLPRIESPVLAIAAINNLGVGMGVTPTDIKNAWEADFNAAKSAAPDRFRLVYFEDTGQFITEEKPEKLDETIAAFLKDVE